MKSLLFLVCVLFVYTYADTYINFNFDGMIPPLPTCNCNATVFCGDGICNGGETNVTCPNDCIVVQPVCGDRSCDKGEDPFNCPADCSVCGDKVCDLTESLSTCPVDCVACGDGFCSLNYNETLANCPVDCSNICGNLACETGESHTSCPADCPCVPQCSGRNCGDNGCGGSCGNCSGTQQCVNGVCTAVCTPNCAGRNCGSDGCTGTCGTCTGTQQCVNGVCTAVCTPNCAGRNCGSDGCSGTCGTCTGTQQCVNGVCTTPCTPSCVGKNCGSDGCGGVCGTCTGTQQCVNGVCTTPCTPNCVGKSCGSDGCGGQCGTCTTGLVCTNGVCGQPSGTRTVTFDLYGLGGGSVGPASGVTVTGSLGTTVSSGGSATLLVVTNDNITFSGAGFQTFTITIYGTATAYSFVLPPTMGPNEVYVIALWNNAFGADLDLHMMGPGNRTQYPTNEGVVDWAWIDKTQESPYANWTGYTGIADAEVIHISKLNFSAPYDFMLFLWSRITGGDSSITWGNSEPYLFLYGGSATGLGYWSWFADQPTPPAGFDYGFWSPFTLRPNGLGGLDVIEDPSPFDPAISLADIASNAQLYYPCQYSTYCPYPLP